MNDDGRKYLARCDGIERMGPYDTEREAWEALEGDDGRGPVKGALVWPVWPDEVEAR